MQNGQCGYVLKPAIMRDEIAFFSANTKDVIPGVSPQILHIKVCVCVCVCVCVFCVCACIYACMGHQREIRDKEIIVPFKF